MNATKRQLALIEAIKAGGFEVTKLENIGKKVWIAAERRYRTEKNPDGCVFLDENLYGCIGPRGRLELNLDSFTSKTKITEPWMLRSRLDEWNWRFPKPSSPNVENGMATEKRSERYKAAWLEGEAAVRAKPLYSPSNPYDEDEDKDSYEGWEAGATSAGWNDIYTNGVLNKSERR